MGMLAIQNVISADILPSVRDIYRDGNYLWASTYDGIVRWNLSEDSFVRFPNDDVLTAVFVRDIVADENGNLWFATKSLTEYDGETWTNYTLVPDQAGRVSFVTTLEIDPDGILWMLTLDGSVYSFSGGTFTRLALDYSVSKLALDSNGTKWFIVYGGLRKFDGENTTIFDDLGGYETSFINSLVIDDNGMIWIGTNDGAIWFDGETWGRYTTSDGLVSNRVDSFGFENDGTIWFGTYDGVSRFDGETWTNYTTADGLVQNVIFCTYIDDDGVKWFGTQLYGISRFDGDSWTDYGFWEVGVSESEPQVIPLGNYPNPFNPCTTITYALAEAGPVTVSVYNLAGQRVETLVDEFQAAGNHSVTWRPGNLSSGIYFYRVESNRYRGEGKMLLMK